MNRKTSSPQYQYLHINIEIHQTKEMLLKVSLMAKRVLSTLLQIEYTTINPYLDLSALKIELILSLYPHSMSIYHLTHALYYNNDRMHSAGSFSGTPEILIKRQ